MDLLTRDDLRTLAETKFSAAGGQTKFSAAGGQTEASLCISLYMPTAHVEADLEQNPIRLKNLLKSTRQQLQQNGHDEEDVAAMLEPARRLLDQTVFWRGMSDGLALFMTPEGMDLYRLPIAFEELGVVGERFHLKPLFPLIASNNRFYVLALSQNQVRLFQGTHYGISEVEGKEIPENIVDALLKFEEPNRQVQAHTSYRNGGGGPDIAPHGQAPQSDDASHRPKDRLKRFFDEIDHGVCTVLEGESAPLVLAGVSYYLPLYREANGYAQLVEDEMVTGNPERLHPKELHKRTWEIVEPLFTSSQAEAMDQFHHQMGNGGLASCDLHEIIPASVYSRVDTLFVPVGRHRWGHYDVTGNAVLLHDEQEAGDEDLLNVATLHTYLNGGTVHALRPENMPTEAHLAATFRYPADVAASDG